MVNSYPPLLQKKYRFRGRPKKEHVPDQGTPELQKKRNQWARRAEEGHSSFMNSWLHLAYKEEILTQDLFELGCTFVRLRIRFLKERQPKGFTLNCLRLFLPSPRVSAVKEEKEGEEEQLAKVFRLIPLQVIHRLDDLLLGEMGYDCSLEQGSLYIKQVKESLTCLSQYSPFFHKKRGKGG